MDRDPEDWASATEKKYPLAKNWDWKAQSVSRDNFSQWKTKISAILIFSLITATH